MSQVAVKGRNCVYAGSFDVFTRGHMNVLGTAAAQEYDTIIIGIGFNKDKTSYFFSPQERIPLIENAIQQYVAEATADSKESPALRYGAERIKNGDTKIIIETYEGYTVDFAIKHVAHTLIRGLRADDAGYEAKLAHANERLSRVSKRNWPISTSNIFTPDPKYMFVSSSLIRDFRNEPEAVADFLYTSTAEAIALKLVEEDRLKAEAALQEKLGRGKAPGGR